MNILDKIVEVVAPQAAVKRKIARKHIEIVNSGYSNYGASHSKNSTRGWFYHGGSAKEDIEDNITTLRQRTRDVYMGVPLATGALKTMRTNVVGSGLRLKSHVDYMVIGISEEKARDLEIKIEREFGLWADSTDCDLERLDNFYELQQLTFLNWLLSGDVITLLPTTKRANVTYDLRIQLIEADRIDTPPNKAFNDKIVSGVEVNDFGEVCAYHIRSTHPLAFENKETKWERVLAYGEKTGRQNVLHIMSRERIGQRRGLPFLAPVIEALKQLGRYTDAELTAAVVSGLYAVFIENPAASSTEGPIGESIPLEQQIAAGENENIELAPGAILELNEGEKANATTPGRPNANFDGFVVAICRQIGAALEIPYELLVKNFNASYSASRGALLEAWKMFKMYRTWLANDFCQPIFNEWLAEAVAKNRIAAPGFFANSAIRKAYNGAEWNGPAQGLLNPVQEVKAAERRIAAGLSTGEREAREMNGSDYYQNIQQRKQEAKLMQEVRKIENPIEKEAENNSRKQETGTSEPRD